jgi:ornithine cyclodeaminase
MEIIDAQTIRSLVTLTSAREAVRAAFVAMSDGTVVAPDELAMVLGHGGELHVKGAYLGGSHLAFKAASGGFPKGGNAGFTAVLDADTGELVAILDDGGWLTEIRTAAASAVSAALLARPESTSLAILGGGFQAAFQVAALREAFMLSDVRSWSRSAATRQRFAAENDTRAMDTVAEAVAGADIVICCTSAREPVLHASVLTPGTHVVAMGSDMLGKRELADDVLESADVVVADSVDVTSRVGELAHVPSAAVRAVELGDVLTGRAAGRTSATQVTVSDHCGLGLQDAAMAQLVMKGINR